MSETKVQKEGLFLRKEDVLELSKILIFARVRIIGILNDTSDPSECIKLLTFCERLDERCEEVIKPDRDKAIRKALQEVKARALLNFLAGPVIIEAIDRALKSQIDNLDDLRHTNRAGGQK